jgi:hypothetical protein
VSRLYDRILAEGCKPLRIDAIVPASMIREKREPDADGAITVPTADETLNAADIEGLPVFLLDDAARYVVERLTAHGPLLADVDADVTASFYGVVRPPFDRCFVEFSGVQVQPGPAHATLGWLVEVEEASEWSTDWLARAKWAVIMTLIVEWQPRVILGPCARQMLPVDANGEPCRSPEGGVGMFEELPTMTPAMTPIEDQFMRYATMMFGFPAIFGFSLMNCKNVDVHEVVPPPRLARKHARRRGAPLTSYYVLDIKPMRRILDTEGEAESKGLAHALHICRGHFKTYTEDAPLFGKRVGTYWWDAQIRGKAEEGVVEKDYRVRLDQGLGREYIAADEHPEIKPTAPEHTGLDPDLGGRGLRAHNVTQNLLASAVECAGHNPRRPRPDEPQYDLAWEAGDVTWVAEVKSITPQNEERQLRQALGQVLRYRQLLAEEGRTVQAMIAAEYEPSDPTWTELCAREEIVLVWPPIALAG